MTRTQATVLSSASVTGAATFLSRILGLAREQLFAYLFGASHAADAFQVAFRIPNLLRDLFAEGALSAALVPTFTRVREEQGAQRAWRVAGLTFRVLAGVASVVMIAGVFFAPWLVDLYASAFREVPEKHELAVRLTQMMFPFFPLVAVAAAIMAVLNASGKFFVPALSSALFNVVSIAVGGGIAYWTHAYPGELLPFQLAPIEAMAVGVVLGGLIQILGQLPLLYGVGYRWVRRSAENPSVLHEPALKRMLALMGPGTFGMAATQINILVNTILATSQGVGAVSWLNYAFRLMQFPIGVFGVSFGTATLPRVSELWVKRDFKQIESTVSQSLVSVLALNLPAAFGLAVLSQPIVRLLFEYGNFTPLDTQATAVALLMYAVGLWAYSVVKVLVPAFYAIENTRIPVLSSVMSIGLTIGLNLLMVRSLGYWGLALGTSIAAIFNAGFLAVMFDRVLRREGGGFALLPMVRVLLRQVGLSSLMALSCGLALHYWPTNLVFFGSRLLQTLVLIGLGVLSLGLFAWVFRVKETLEIGDLVRRRLKNRLR